MGALVDQLVACGYVERAPDPGDGRARLIRLTDRGWAFGATVRRLVRQAEADWAALVGPERVEALRRLLTDLVAALERRPGGGPAGGPPAPGAAAAGRWAGGDEVWPRA
jgi:DNA-binding MarR family transcriptional regulator